MLLTSPSMFGLMRISLLLLSLCDSSISFSLDPSRPFSATTPPPLSTDPSSSTSSSSSAASTNNGGSNPTGGTELDGVRPPIGRTDRSQNQLPGGSGALIAESDNPYRKSNYYFSQFFGRTSNVDVAMDGAATLKPMPMYPADIHFDRIEGVKTVRNYRIPYGCERVQYVLSTPTGRPLKATVELWIGPIRKVHTLEIKSEKAPVRATLKFKKGVEVITIRTSENGQYPVSACVMIPTPERSEELNANTERVWKQNKKTKIQGGLIQGGKTKTVGAIRYFTLPVGAIAVQMIVWSKDVGKKSFRLKIEILQGPNNVKQTYGLQCGGGTQPYHTIYELGNDFLPGSDGSIGGGVMRIINQKYLEDGLVQVVVVPIFPEGSNLTGEVTVY
jgi:hypothetical protein